MDIEKYKTQFENYCKKMNFEFNQEMFDVYCWDQEYKKEHKMSANSRNCIEILLDMVNGEYDMPLMERYQKFKSFKAMTYSLERCQLRYGNKLGKEKFDSYRNKQAYSNSFEYKQEKHGWTKDEFDEFNKSRAVTLSNMIKKHGKKLGKQKFEAYCKRQAYAGNKKEYFIEKYGEEEGLERYNKMIKQKSLTLSTFIEKYGEEEGTKRYQDFREKLFQNKTFDKAYSKVSQDLFNKLRKLLNDDENIQYATFGGEVPFYSMESNIGGYIDFVYKTKAIEFYGDWWHLNPKVLGENKTMYRYGRLVTSEEVHEIDAKRIDLVKEAGYDVLIVWENDYKNNEEMVIKQCMEFLNAENS